MRYILNSGVDRNMKEEEFLVPTLEGFEERIQTKTILPSHDSRYNRRLCPML